MKLMILSWTKPIECICSLKLDNRGLVSSWIKLYYACLNNYTSLFNLSASSSRIFKFCFVFSLLMIDFEKDAEFILHNLPSNSNVDFISISVWLFILLKPLYLCNWDLLWLLKSISLSSEIFLIVSYNNNITFHKLWKWVIMNM